MPTLQGQNPVTFGTLAEMVAANIANGQIAYVQETDFYYFRAGGSFIQLVLSNSIDYGDGIEGDRTMTGETDELERAVWYDDLTIDANSVLDTGSYDINVSGTLDIYGILKRNGVAGSAVDIDNAPTVPGNGGLPLASGDVGGGAGGGAGGVTTAADDGQTGLTLGGNGGNGGAGGLGDNGAGLAGGSGGAGHQYYARRITDLIVADGYLIGGAGGGGGGAGGRGYFNARGAGGGGGSGGGVIRLRCKTLIIRPGGSIQSKGGAGAVGSNVPQSGGGLTGPQLDMFGAAGGAGGGGGGAVLIQCDDYTIDGEVNVDGGAGGIKGSARSNSSKDSLPGTDGEAGTVLIFHRTSGQIITL